MFLNFINRLENIHFALLPNQLKPFIMEAVKIIVQNKYFKVIEVYGVRYINLKKAGESIKVNGELFYKLPAINTQSNTLAFL